MDVGWYDGDVENRTSETVHVSVDLMVPLDLDWNIDSMRNEVFVKRVSVCAQVLSDFSKEERGDTCLMVS